MGREVQICAMGRRRLPARALRRARRKSPLCRASARRTALPPRSCCTLTCRGHGFGAGGVKRLQMRASEQDAADDKRGRQPLHLPDAGVQLCQKGGVKVVPQHGVPTVQLGCASTRNAMCSRLDTFSRHNIPLRLHNQKRKIRLTQIRPERGLGGR